jgi:hypothetical protein
MESKELSSNAYVFDNWVYQTYRDTEIFDLFEKHLGVQFVYKPSAGLATAADKGMEKDA